MSNKEENDYATGVYRCKDPVKNFKIRVRLQHDKSSFIPLPQFQHDEGEAASTPHISSESPDMEEQVFSWQEKVFSPFERSYYRYAGNCHTALEEKYHRDIIELCRESTPNNRLFSYTDADDFTDMEETNQSVTTDGKPMVTPLVEGMSELRRRQKFGHKKSHRKDIDFSKRKIVEYKPSIELKKKNHLLHSSLQTLYILADLSVQDSDENWAGKSEYVLCTVRWDSISGVLTVTPDFTSVTPPAEDINKLEPYRIEVDGDARNTYCYWIEHVSPSMSQEERDKEVAVIKKLYEHHLDIRQLQVGTEFEMPRHGILQVLILGEITTARDFEYDHLFVHYFFELPKGWSCDSENQLAGITQTCNTRTGIANFSYVFELQLTFNLEVLQSETDTLLSWPQMFLSVLSIDSWNQCRTEGYGYVSLPSSPGVHKITVSTWRPLSSSPLGELRRFFIGGSPELEDPSFVGIPSDFEGNLLSKHGLQTITSGEVTLKLNILHHSQALIRTGSSAGYGEHFFSANKHSAFLLERLSAATLVNSVNAVLIAFKRARERMLKARESLET